LVEKEEMLNNMIEGQSDQMTDIFEPEIIAFCCRHCAYAAADLAGSMRIEYPSSLKIIELPCTGKIDVIYLLDAFEKGADGVLVAG
jgi:F420-non-reducing hydrogenase iron-sulfur subunit